MEWVRRMVRRLRVLKKSVGGLRTRLGRAGEVRVRKTSGVLSSNVYIGGKDPEDELKFSGPPYRTLLAKGLRGLLYLRLHLR